MWAQLWRLSRGVSLFRLGVRPVSGGRGAGRPTIKFNVSGMEKISGQQTWGEWIVSTPTRKKIGNRLVVGGLSAVTGGLMFVNFFELDYVKGHYSERLPGAPKFKLLDYLSGEESSVYLVSPETRSLATFNQARAGLTDDMFDNVDIFVSSLLDPVVVGSSRARYGALVGLPRHLMATSPDQVDLSSYRVKPYWNRFFSGYSIPTEGVDPETLEKLKESLVLSPEARSSIVAKCLDMTSRWYRPAADTFLPGILNFIHYVFGVHLNQTAGLMQRPRPLRLAVQAIWLSAIILMGLYIMSEIRQYSEQASIHSVVRTAAEARGAVEYYEKALTRNRLLRQLIGPEAEYYFEEDGEVVAPAYEFPENVSYKGFRDYCQTLADSLAKQEEEEEKNKVV